jgi:hypothetical protein
MLCTAYRQKSQGFGGWKDTSAVLQSFQDAATIAKRDAADATEKPSKPLLTTPLEAPVNRISRSSSCPES